MTAAEIGAASGIPESVIVEKFGLRGKHIAAADEHVSDLAVAAASRLLEEQEIDPADDRRGHVLRLDLEGLRRLAGGAVDRAPARLRQRLRGRVRQRLDGHAGRAAGSRAPSSSPSPSCGARWSSRPAASRTCSTTGTSARGSCSTSATAPSPGSSTRGRRAERDARLARDHRRVVRAAGEGAGRRLASSRPRTRASTGGATSSTSPTRRSMKGGLDEVSLAELRRRRRAARSSARAPRSRDVSYLCGIHMKRSMHEAIVAALGIDPGRAAYLDDTGHMSGVDPLLALDRAVRAGEIVRRRSRAAARRGHRLHVGGDRRPLGERDVSTRAG